MSAAEATAPTPVSAGLPPPTAAAFLRRESPETAPSAFLLFPAGRVPVLFREVHQN